MVVLSRLAAQSRTVLAAGITVLLDAYVFWFVIKCDATYEFYLCHHLRRRVRDYGRLYLRLR